MSTVHERLAAMGIRLFGDGPPEVVPDLARIAIALDRRGCRTLGLVPAADDVGVPAVALVAGHAFAEAAGAPTAVVDAQGSWFAEREPPATDPHAPVFTTSWLTARLALLVPRAVPAGATVRDLDACLRAEARAMRHIVVDLTGADHTGEHLDAIDYVDAIAIVARAGHTTSRQLARWMREIPPAKNLGVLLVGEVGRAGRSA